MRIADIAWHSLAPDESCRRLATRPGGRAPAEAAERRVAYGPNILEVRRSTSAWRILASQSSGTLSLLLMAGTAIALLTGDTADAVAVATVLVLNIALGFVSELKANRAMESLVRLDVPRATVLRGGTAETVPAADLVPGDVIVVEAGELVPADARLLRGSDLAVDESALTGESLSADKRAEAALTASTPLADRATMLYKATAVVRGRGHALVTATGMQTEVGRIGRLTAGVRRGRTPLEIRLEELGRWLAAVAIVAAVIVGALGLLQGHTWPVVAATALALAVAAVPEGLPVVATIAMAIGLHRMARRRALIRRLPAVETLGSTTIICADKTGTLTAGRMTVVTCWTEGAEALPDDPRAAAVLRAGARASDAIDPMDRAIRLAAGTEGQVEPGAGFIPFSSARLWTASVTRRGGELTASLKGAPERILSLCTHWASPQGPQPLDEPMRATILAANTALARRGLRVLAVADGVVANAQPAAFEGLLLRGLVGLTDPPAPQVRETIQRFRDAGLRTLMITGDQRPTAEAVAGQLGLLEDGRTVLDGSEADRLDTAELGSRLAGIAAISRASPETKMRIVAALQRSGEIVAMLGDGVNDAAALRRADIGVAMGARGTDLAKDAADLILQDDRFETIGSAIEEGRVVFANIRRFVFYLFSCNLAEVLVLLGAGLMGLPALLPLQILWLNLVTDTFPALALAGESAEPDVMRQPPRPPHEAILPAAQLRPTVGYALLIAAVTLIAAHAGGRQGTTSGMTLAFHTLALAQLFHLGNARGREPVVGIARATANPWALAAVGLVILLQLGASAFTPLASLLRLAPMGTGDWLMVAVLAGVPGATGQILKSAGVRRAQQMRGS